MTTPREIIANSVFSDRSNGMNRLAGEPLKYAFADDVIEGLETAGYCVVKKDNYDSMHRRAQITEGLFESIKIDLEMWVHVLDDRRQWLDTWLFKNALGRWVRLTDRANTKLTSHGIHLMTDADLAARDDAVLERAAAEADRIAPLSAAGWNSHAAWVQRVAASIRSLKGGKP